MKRDGKKVQVQEQVQVEEHGKDISYLLKNMNPVLNKNEFVFVAITNNDVFDYERLHSLSYFKEDEGQTLIIPRDEADKNNFKYTSVFRQITLSVNSSLEAIGFLSIILKKLAEAEISVNPVSAFYHDHLFVPNDKAEYALKLLVELSVNS